MNVTPYTIGKLAQAASVTVETVRFYERKGLIKQPEKQSGFRYYPESDIHKIRFIKRAQELGFSLSETQNLLTLTLEDTTCCQDVLSKTQEKMEEVDKKIHDLQKIKTALANLKNCCDDPKVPLKECPILDYFMEAQ